MAKPQITTRTGKSLALTYEELDANFENLQNATISVAADGNTITLDLNDTLTLTPGDNISFDVSGNSVTINGAAGGTSDINYYGTIAGDSGSATADAPNSTFNITTNSFDISTTVSGDDLTIALERDFISNVRANDSIEINLGPTLEINTADGLDANWENEENSSAKYLRIGVDADNFVALKTDYQGNYINVPKRINFQGPLMLDNSSSDPGIYKGGPDQIDPGTQRDLVLGLFNDEVQIGYQTQTRIFDLVVGENGGYNGSGTISQAGTISVDAGKNIQLRPNQSGQGGYIELLLDVLVNSQNNSQPTNTASPSEWWPVLTSQSGTVGYIPIYQ